MIDDPEAGGSESGAWTRAFGRGCLTETIARCKACDAPDCTHPDPVFAGIIPIPTHQRTGDRA